MIKRPFEHISFTEQFLLVSAIVLAAGASAVGTWLGRQIEQTAVNRAALISSIYVESILAAQLHGWTTHGTMDDESHAMLDRIFVEGPLARKVVRFKLWDRDGTVIYSSDHKQVGTTFALSERLTDAFRGNVHALVSSLDGPDHQVERQRWKHLLEVYVPVRRNSAGEPIAVAEFYHSMTNLDNEIDVAQQKSWGLIALGALGLYAVLYGLVRRANNTIVLQKQDLGEQLGQLEATLAENEGMRQNLCDAGARTTALNEQLLHRIAADLHDGPAQDLAFALLRFEDLAQECDIRRRDVGASPRDLELIQSALRSALEELRSIAAGLGVPGIADLSLADTLRRAVYDVERKMAGQVAASIDDALIDAPIAVKITAYRVLQESLTNAFRYAPDHSPRIRARKDDEAVLLEISDQGGGFEPANASASGRLGIAFMRERVRLLGGTFKIDSSPSGTTVIARLPLFQEGIIHE